MSMDVWNLALFMGLGAIAGICSGLLGIGGGMVIVPGLFFLFGLVQIPDAALMHMAAGTATCIMIFTSASSTWAHHRRGHIHWDMFRRVIGGIAAGVIVGNLMGNHLNSSLLELLFGLFLVGVSIKIFLGRKVSLGEVVVTLPTLGLATLAGLVIGFKSGVLGIGGGALSVPFLLYCGLPMNHATGTSASFTLPIAIIGTASFILLAGNQQAIIPWATGYVYWPAVALVAPFSMLGAPLGAQWSDGVPADQLRNLFAAFLLLVSLKMLAGTGYLSVWV